MAIVCLFVVWHFFKQQIITALGWLALLAVVFGAGWLMGRFSRRKAEAEEAKMLKK